MLMKLILISESLYFMYKWIHGSPVSYLCVISAPPSASCDPKCTATPGQGTCQSDGKCLCWWGWTGPNAQYILSGTLKNRIMVLMNKWFWCDFSCHDMQRAEFFNFCLDTYYLILLVIHYLTSYKQIMSQETSLSLKECYIYLRPNSPASFSKKCMVVH